MLCAEPFRRERRVLRPHRVIVADWQQRIIDGIALAEEFHIGENRRITGEIHRLAAHADDVAARAAARDA